MSGRGAANVLTRTTSILAAAFLLTSLVLGILARQTTEFRSIIRDGQPAPASDTALPPVQLPRLPQAPDGAAPAVPAPAAPAPAIPAPAAPAAPAVPQSQ
jgi:preprotein translocase subunit SecG